MVSVDCVARYRGWSGDAAISFIVGEHPDPQVISIDQATTSDGWTLRTADGTRAAHIEHTVAITENGPVVLTQLARTSQSIGGRL